jgi:transporter family protein
VTSLLPLWMVFALAVLAFWGLAGITQKLSTNYISAELSFIICSLAFIPVSLIILWLHPVSWKLSPTGWELGVVGGLLSGVGGLASFAAYHSGGKASIVTPIGAMYPMITVALAVPFLHERVGLRQVAGIILALMATVAISYEEGSKATSSWPPEKRP